MHDNKADYYRLINDFPISEHFNMLLACAKLNLIIKTIV